MFRRISIAMILGGMCAALALAGQQGPPAGAGDAGQGGGGRGRAGRGGTPTTTMIKPGLVLANTGVLGDQNIQQLMDMIKMISDKPVKYAVVGDVHQDKSGGTGAFA